MIAIYDLLNFMGKYIPFIGIDTLGGLIFAYLTNIAYNMYLIKGFYDTIPTSLEEAAIVDGATRFQSFYKIIIPLARPILTVVFLLVFIGTFNEYVVARIILQNVRHYTYALGLQAFATGPYETEWGLFTAAALLGMTPMVILFLSLQRYLVSGLTRGAVKE
jgi:maltose/maltodextrin transport system permease protein